LSAAAILFSDSFLIKEIQKGVQDEMMRRVADVIRKAPLPEITSRVSAWMR